MSPRFPLQRLLRLRQQHEQAKARELVAARDAADVERQAHDALRRAREISQEHVARVTTEAPTVGTLVSLTLALDHLDEHHEAADERARAAESVVDVCHEAFTAAARARQVLDKLKARHDTEARAAENARDQQTMDSIALTRFTQEVRINTPERNRAAR